MVDLILRKRVFGLEFIINFPNCQTGLTVDKHTETHK